MLSAFDFTNLFFRASGGDLGVGRLPHIFYCGWILEDDLQMSEMLMSIIPSAIFNIQSRQPTYNLEISDAFFREVIRDGGLLDRVLNRCRLALLNPDNIDKMLEITVHFIKMQILLCPELVHHFLPGELNHLSAHLLTAFRRQLCSGRQESFGPVRGVSQADAPTYSILRIAVECVR